MSHGVRGGVRAARAEPRRDEVVRAWPRLSVVLVADLVATEGLLRRQQDADVGDMRSDDALVVVLEEERRVAHLAITYHDLGRLEEAHRILREVYSGTLKLNGEEHEKTINAALNYVASLCQLQRFEETKALLGKTIPVARRVLGESHELTLRVRWNYARVLYTNDAATLDDLREAMTTLEETGRIARRVFGGAHPTTEGMEDELQNLRAALRARETPEKLAQDAFRTARR